ncbi:hypothetical protein M9H77_07822 [Catharanthus roseus]|uniref:Uncharacterized protein n=1 Tax=Catharanthus roseus TaxID=4058 RepID=A0ACC0BW96_CATRO|nr:hypothetical protein M9H77_07822 [Catharanthus roseus]
MPMLDRMAMVKKVEVVEVGRIQTCGNVVTSRKKGKNIAFDDRLLNSILETPEDGMLFYTKNKKCFDPNLYSEKRKMNFGYIAIEHMLAINPHQQNVCSMVVFLPSEEEEEEEEEGNEPEDMDEDETNEEEIQRKLRRKKQQEKAKEGPSSGSMTQLMELIASLQASMNSRFDNLDGKISDI